jgi:hypothetical protein
VGLNSLFPKTPNNDSYQINTFPIDGKYIKIIGSNGHKIAYYSYDIDEKNKIIQEKLDITEYDFRNLEKKIIYTLPANKRNFNEFHKDIIGVSYNQLEEPIFFYQTFKNSISSIFSVKYQQEHLLYSQKSSDYPLYDGFFHKPNHKIRFNYLLLL